MLSQHFSYSGPVAQPGREGRVKRFFAKSTWLLVGFVSRRDQRSLLVKAGFGSGVVGSNPTGLAFLLFSAAIRLQEVFK